ncbi:MAG TPA: response regulator, partial [Vicinamibacteria bacterium]|nr:response regulator [Vicinamibacteria bacterium]
PGRGTTFKVYLPRVEGEPERLTRGNATGQTVRGGSETILLAEDEEALRAIVLEILEAGGYTVLAGVTPEEVLLAARSHAGPIHLMLTDVVMPGMSGRELAGRVQAVQPGARVLYMSGYTDEAISHHGVLDSGTLFIQKPFTVEALLRRLREVLEAPAEG